MPALYLPPSGFDMADNLVAATAAVKKLTKWAKEPSILDLKQDYQEAKSYHDSKTSQISEWLDNLNVTGKAKVKTPEGSSRIVPKLIRKQAEWRYPALSEPFLSTDDVFSVRPVTWEDKKAAQQNQLILNNQFNTRIDKVSFVDEYVRAAVDEGTVILRTGWAFEEEEYTEIVPDVEYVFNDEAAPMMQHLDQMAQQAPDQYEQEVEPELKQAHQLYQQHGRPVEALVKGHKPVKKTRVIKNHPTVEVCDYRNVMIDPTCQGDIDKASFVIYSFESSLAQLKKEGDRYKNLDQINVTANSILGEPDHAPANEHSKNFNFSDEARKKFVVYEYWGFWDIDGSGVVRPIVAAWVGDTLIRMEDNPFPDQKLPFVVVPYLPVRKSIYGEPDGKLIEDNQDILGAVTRGMIDIMGRSANGQTLMTKGMLDASNLKKYENGEHAYTNPGFDPRVNIHMQTYPEIPNSAMQMINMQNQEAESLTGVIAFNTGISGNALGSTATGVRSALDSASKRELGILRRLSKGIEQIGRKFIAMNSEFLEDEEIIRISNDFVKIRRDDLAGNFDLIVNVSTAEVDNQKIEKLAFMMQTGQQTMDPEEAKLVRAEIYRLQKMPELAEKVLTFQPQPDPIQQQMQQLQLEAMMLNNEKLKAEIQERNSRANENAIDMDLKRAKAQNEWNKAGLVNSEKDLKNLEFIQKESGIDFDREMAKKEHDRVAGLDSIAMTNMFQHKGQTK